MGSELGVALTLKAHHPYQGQRPGKRVRQGPDSGVVVVYSRPGEVSPAIWRKALTFAAEQLLPVVFVVLPAAGRRGGAGPGAMSAVASRHGVPGMAVDADDAVALYRVAQEAIGRARIGGGAALMECVPFVLEGAEGRRPRTSVDAIAAAGAVHAGTRHREQAMDGA